MSKYQNGKIYSIRSHQTDEIYIGSTIQPLHKRIHQHKSEYKKWKEGKRDYTTSFKIIEYGDAYIELICLYPCNSKEELHRREGEEMRNCDCVNKYIAGRTEAEYRRDNKERLKKASSEYYKKNKEQLAVKKKIKNKEKMTCECGSTFRRGEKARHYRTKIHLNFINNNI